MGKNSGIAAVDHQVGDQSREKRLMNPDDIRLRAHGFRIESRPAKGEAIWSRGKQKLRHSDAVTLINLVEEREELNPTAQV